MGILNRSAVDLRPKQPYLEWTRLDDAEGLAKDVFETLREEPILYLVPDWEETDEEREILDELWPMGRKRKMFDDWFEVETFSMLEDVYRDEAIESI